MKTTRDLPDDLIKKIKLEAARRHRKMKDLAAEAMRKGLRNDSEINEDIALDLKTVSFVRLLLE